jgi:hypothetical protein
MIEIPNEAAALMAKGEFESADALLEPALRTDPDSIPLRLAYSESLAMQLQFDQAIEQCLRILHAPTVRPIDSVVTLERLASCATQAGQPEIVRPYLRAFDALSKSPYPSDRCWPPRILRQAGFLDEAREAFEGILREFPGDPFTTLFLGEVMLELGDPAGLALIPIYSSRAFARLYLSGVPSTENMWEDEPLEGKSVAVVSCGGHGDFFQFAAHVAQLRRLGARPLTAVVTARYEHLLKSAGFDEVVPVQEMNAAIAGSDYWTTTFGLARAELNGGGSRRPSGYMTPPPSDIADGLSARMREKAAGRPCLGLYWHSDQHLGHVKSVPMARLIPLLTRRDVHWVILQRGYGLRRLIEAGLNADVTVADDVLPFDDAGALMARLDGMVSICAWPFHLAGAVGTRVWLLAGRILSARHLNSDGASYLYPDCATVVRQPTLGDWPGAIARMNRELDAFVAGFTVPAPKDGHG